ncbi:MAG: dockerin type I repeat-containing protein [Oscillospiraceae bacterium]|nr:dockerin type I repeat-containing protein [Oscillospiraceae bacterium]
MKKQKLISAAVSAVMAVSYAGCFPGIYKAGAEEAENSLIANRMEFYTDLHEVDNSGYFEAAFEDYAAKVGNLGYKDDNYKGKCVSYISNRVENNAYFLLTFPEAKEEMYISFVKNDDDVKNKVTKEILDITGGTRETDYSGSTALILADEIGEEKFAEVMKICQPYIDDEIIREVKYDQNSLKSYETHISFDKLYYSDNVYVNKGYDFEAVAAFLKQKGEKCRVIKAYTNDTNTLYTIDPEKDSDEERLRIAKLIKDEFGYEFDLSNTDFRAVSEYKTAQFIPASYTEPKNDTPEKTEVQSAVSDVTKSGNIVYGDLNGDGKTDVTDLTFLSLHLIGDNIITDAALLEAADVQPDGTVNLSDLARFRQYLSKKTDSIGKTQDIQTVPEEPDESELTDITDISKTVNAGPGFDKWNYNVKSVMISSMEDYDKYIGIDSEENKNIAKQGVEVNDEFFKTNRLAVMIDNSESCNGVEFTLTGVKLDKEGNVHLYYDKFVPEMMTALASVSHFITVVPADDNKESNAFVHFNVIHERTDITDQCMIMNSTGVVYKNHGTMYPSVSGMVTSMDQFTEEMDKYGIEPSDVIERFGISEKFFDDYFLIYHTDYASNTNPKNRIVSVTVDYKNNLQMNVSRYTTVRYNDEGVPYSMGGEMEVNWFLAAAVPKSVTDPSEVVSFDAKSVSSQDENGFSIYNKINERAVVSDSATEFEFKDREIRFIDSVGEFDRINEFYGGKFSHLKDEFLTDDFFKDNMLFIMCQPSEKKNVKYNILNLSMASNAVLSVQVGKFINAEDAADDDITEWHLAAAVPRSELVFEKSELSAKISYKTEEALLGRFE